jgi:hypothetical protein
MNYSAARLCTKDRILSNYGFSRGGGFRETGDGAKASDLTSEVSLKRGRRHSRDRGGAPVVLMSAADVSRDE